MSDIENDAPAELTVAFTPRQLLLIAVAVVVVLILVRRARGISA